METRLAQWFKGSPDGERADRILRSCVHCGFCNATCPTYQLTGDELDGPRGRIYLIKQVLEGHSPTARTQLHLDRCLTCRACETTCPSGVDYHHLLDIGRALVAQGVQRPLIQRITRYTLRQLLSRSRHANRRARDDPKPAIGPRPARPSGLYHRFIQSKSPASARRWRIPENAHSTTLPRSPIMHFDRRRKKTR